MNLNRRGFISGLAALVTAPAIVRIDNIMPVRSLEPYRRYLLAYSPYLDAVMLRVDVSYGILKVPLFGAINLTEAEAQKFHLSKAEADMIKKLRPLENQQLAYTIKVPHYDGTMYDKTN